MERFRRQKNDAYTTISTVFLRDARLSLKSKGFMALIMSLPETWDFSVAGMSAILKEGKTAIYNCLNELIEFRYCQRVYLYEAGKRIGVDYVFLEVPTDTPQELHSQNLNLENLNLGSLNLENLPQYNIDSNIEKNEEKAPVKIVEKDIWQGVYTKLSSYFNGGIKTEALHRQIRHELKALASARGVTLPEAEGITSQELEAYKAHIAETENYKFASAERFVSELCKKTYITNQAPVTQQKAVATLGTTPI